MSNHMIGAAIDIDADIGGAARNPHLNAKQIAVLDAVLTFRIKQNKLDASKAPNPSVDIMSSIMLHHSLTGT